VLTGSTLCYGESLAQVLGEPTWFATWHLRAQVLMTGILAIIVFMGVFLTLATQSSLYWSGARRQWTAAARTAGFLGRLNRRDRALKGLAQFWIGTDGFGAH
jgi:hypothetical protein